MQDLTWNFIATEEHTGEFNMSFDEMLVQRLIGGTGLPALRLYRWKPWAISLGHHQNLADIDMQRCKDDGMDVVRRPTGGRAILHAEELTYSVVMMAGRKGIHQVYNEISAALVEGLRAFGVDVSLQRSQPNFTGMYKNPSSIACFSSSARYELEWNGRKLVGSAQRRYIGESGEVVLQHGSILCGKGHRRLVNYLALKDEVLRLKILEDLVGKTTDLQEISGMAVDIAALSDCIRKGFERAWGVTFTEADFTSGVMKGAYA